jgi:hypothetical protein
MRPEAALFLFHLRVGTRLALRVLAPVLAATFFLYYVLWPEFTVELARILFLEASLVESGTIGGLLLLALARVVAPRITSGGAGWARSLPATGGALRRLAVLSLVVGESPLLAVLGGLAWMVTGPDPGRIATRLAGLMVGAAAAGLTRLPDLSPLRARLLALIACFLSFSGNGAVLAAAAGLLILAAAFPAGPAASRKRRRPRRSLPAAVFFHGLSLRALRGRIALAYPPPALVLAVTWLVLEHNELPADTAFSLSLFGLVLSLTVFFGAAADVLAARRPAWPWLRTLPRSAAARVRDDALFLGLQALPVAGGLVLLRRPAREAALLAGPLAWLAFRSAGAMREAGDRPFGVVGHIVVEGTILSLVVALVPWTSWLLAAAAPVAFLLARDSERRLKPSRWIERRHSSAGDPLSWSAS